MSVARQTMKPQMLQRTLSHWVGLKPRTDSSLTQYTMKWFRLIWKDVNIILILLVLMSKFVYMWIHRADAVLMWSVSKVASTFDPFSHCNNSRALWDTASQVNEKKAVFSILLLYLFIWITRKKIEHFEGFLYFYRALFFMFCTARNHWRKC